MRKILFAAMVLGATPAMADEGDVKLSGLRIEAHAGIERPNLSDSQAGTTYVDTLGSSFAYGGEIGFDLPVSGSVTVGPYVSIDSGGSDKCETYPGTGNSTGTACFHSNSNISVGARAGFRVGSKAEVFLGVGYDMYDADFTIQEVDNTTSAVTFAYASTGSRKGVGIKFGGNYHLSKNVYVGLGMHVSELGDFEGSGFKLQRFQGHAALGLRF